MKYTTFLDNMYINMAIIIILILYNSQLFSNINKTIGNLYKYNFVKLLILLFITYIAPKDTNIAILLGISYVISLNNIYIEKFEDNNNKIIYEINHKINNHEELTSEDIDYLLKSEPIYKNNIFKLLFKKKNIKLDKFDTQIMNLINEKKDTKYIVAADFAVARGIPITNYSYDNSKYSTPQEYAQNKFFSNL